ncbi:hypothetical protein EV401DRAFT_2068643 [Pisolithus croceorrhizus]|nr:hypothetical protein EV401DRAFT_2068643 [Pisolithus croceorrhizus]
MHLGRGIKTLQGWLQQQKPTVKPVHVQFIGIKHGSDLGATGHILLMLYNSLHKDCTFEIDQFPLVEQTRVTLSTCILHMNLEIPPCVANMHQDVPWHESTDDFQDKLEDDSSDDDTEYDPMDDMYDQWDDLDDDYGVQWYGLTWEISTF